jgi:hypothetical protein
MNLRVIILSFLLSIIYTVIFSQEPRKIHAFFTESDPKIDGVLDDITWKKNHYDSKFIQFEPYNKQKPSDETYIKICYDNTSIYVAAFCRVENINELYTVFSERDNFGQADYFGFYIDPYNTGITGYGFFVTAAGTQIDLNIDNNNLNYDWDAVWHSGVNATDSGYTVEMKIPYSAFRFPQKDEQSWGINFYRNIQKNREISTWNFVDNTQTGILTQLGIVENIKNISPPIRLSIMPYVSSYVQKYTDNPFIGKSYNGGLDIKYGINESFTIDMMLIPDFNQIQSDDQILNLSPYETYYNEKRFFFTEGVDIFNKGDIFYSRRIGKEPTDYQLVKNQLSENEIIISNPQITQIFNATKFSGKTNKGLGIGFLNAFTGSTYAEISDTVYNVTRTVLTEPFSNYNIIAINQSLKNNSYISLTNTAFSSFGRNYNSFVTAQESYLRNRSNSWAVFQSFSLSQIFNDTLDANRGFAYRINISKIRGNFRVAANQTVYSPKYNPNDLGFLRQNNIISNSLTFAYNIYKPFWYFLQWRNSISVNQQNLFEDFQYIGTDFLFTSSTKFKNNLSVGLQITLTPDEVYDYFEPRAENKFYVRDPHQKFRLWFSSNYAEAFAYDLVGELHFAKLDEDSQNGFSFTNSPRIRFSDKVFFVYSNNIRYNYNDVGFVGKSSTTDSIFFGKRNIKTTTNIFELNYILSRNASLSFKARHYWSMIDYFNYYTLGSNGRLYPLFLSYQYFKEQDQNYNALSIDVYFRWIFMPGSEFSIVYKKQITTSATNLVHDYYENFENMYFEYPHLNSLSFKLIFYLDYQTIRSLF